MINITLKCQAKNICRKVHSFHYYLTWFLTPRCICAPLLLSRFMFNLQRVKLVWRTWIHYVMLSSFWGYHALCLCLSVCIYMLIKFAQGNVFVWNFVYTIKLAQQELFKLYYDPFTKYEKSNIWWFQFSFHFIQWHPPRDSFLISMVVGRSVSCIFICKMQEPYLSNQWWWLCWFWAYHQKCFQQGYHQRVQPRY